MIPFNFTCIQPIFNTVINIKVTQLKITVNKTYYYYYLAMFVKDCLLLRSNMRMQPLASLRHSTATK